MTPDCSRIKKESYVCYSEPGGGTGGGGFDFLLTSHGAGLGTSKPVHYRVILDENAVIAPAGGATPLTKRALEQATYEMSFQYSTATKVRANNMVICIDVILI